MKKNHVVIGEIKDFTYDNIKKGLQELDSKFNLDKVMFEYLQEEFVTYQDLEMDKAITQYKNNDLDAGDIDAIIWLYTDYRVTFNDNEKLIITRKVGK